VTGKPNPLRGDRGEIRGARAVFQPERIASRILGMGDVLSLVEQVQEQVDQEKRPKSLPRRSARASRSISWTCAIS